MIVPLINIYILKRETKVLQFFSLTINMYNCYKLKKGVKNKTTTVIK